MIIRITDNELLRRADTKKLDLVDIDKRANNIDSIRRDETLTRSGISDLETLISEIKLFQDTVNQLILADQADPIPSHTEEAVLKRNKLAQDVKRQRESLEELLASLLCKNDILKPSSCLGEKPMMFTLLAYEANDSIRVQIAIENCIVDI